MGEMGGALAAAVLAPAFVACSSDSAPTADVETSSATSVPVAEETGGPVATAELRWARANLGFVSAYVLARGNRAALVDTGVSGSADAIGETLAALGLTYNDVEHVILTHKHGDHAGSMAEVMDRAVNATAWAGEPDLDDLSGDISALVGGEDVFGFEALPTPGHTAGHMAVIDHQNGLLVAGDALWTDNGSALEGPAQFFSDIDESRETIKLLGGLAYNTLLVGHGEPIEAGASAAVAALAGQL